MDLDIALILTQDGITTGAVYALLAIALVLVFAVTRVIFIPQGEYVAYGALTMAMLQQGKVPGTLWLLVAMGAFAALLDGIRVMRGGARSGLAASLGWTVAYPLALAALLYAMPATQSIIVQAALTLAILVPLGPLMYRLAYQPVAEGSVLVLLIVSVAIHVSMVGLGLLFFGAEGSRTPAFSDAQFSVGALAISGQQVWVVVASAALIVGLWLFFDRSLYGKALRATAINRNGARLMGFSPVFAGKLTFVLAAFIGVLSGILIAPLTTIYYDTGFLIGLKGFVAAIIGGLASYPIAAAGALLVGVLESFSSFWASAYKEVFVFTLIIPVLVWRSLTSHHIEEDE
ncbi:MULTISPECIES: branched-chain amino acid ABC transporter permease [Zoogloea]|jgi:branched-chain amino acid transport system permease protein|uniref:Branched-chain amino acid ABC transporter permease n=1 Tax=Zoogloea oleivorans TaxID=1552750 RepID=A0A6C2CYY3_9RHOO|nr:MULTISPECIES: branched-chain amino acid ABC transporter permease [Zoogloea]MBT9496302.1 branched-chain amino acid ABC transporter permease [Zoogloea sp.]MDD2668770.1 branched-chain amino acid ABC transporter permease [Zoogloea sp.]TYC58874.1 branched-chain amino acid ABC transporter permease [Zoogloea oleivorans]